MHGDERRDLEPNASIHPVERYSTTKIYFSIIFLKIQYSTLRILMFILTAWKYLLKQCQRSAISTRSYAKRLNLFTSWEVVSRGCPGLRWLVGRQRARSRALIGGVGYEREAEGDTSNVYMQSLVVDRAFRKQGIGRLLSNALYEDVVNPGEQLVALARFWNNDFFQKLGFYKVNPREIKEQDAIAGREKHKYCTAWMKDKAQV